MKQPTAQFVYKPCDPPVAPVTLGSDEPATISARIRVLFAEDQAARQSTPIDWSRISVEDAQRRHETLSYLNAGQLCAPESLYYAAFIFQHGNCLEHYDLAHQLAKWALERGYTQARWICAATRDRALMSRGLPQKYGTQYIAYGDGPLELYDYDRATTDEERAQYDVPPLHELLRRVQPNAD